MKVVIAAAGTAGHINPGLAIANKIREKEKNSKIIFIGTTYGLENDLVPRAGYDLKTIDAHGLSKKLTIENMKKIIKTIKGISQAKRILTEFKPDIVIGTGGYICGPVLIAAKKLKIPTMLHESNAFPGRAVKMLAKNVDTIMCGFEDAKPRLKKAKNVVVTGTPIKIKKLDINKEKIIKEFNLNINLPIVLAFGGSQGAKSINDTIFNMIGKDLIKNYQVILSSGAKQYDIIKQRLEEKNMSINNVKNVKILPYIYNMEEIMNISDLILCRSGAMTINEISAIEKPAIFIPLPNVSQNHQEYNAKVLQNVGAAKIILDSELNADTLYFTINNILQDKENLKIMGENAKKIQIKDIDEKIYSEIIKCLK